MPTVFLHTFSFAILFTSVALNLFLAFIVYKSNPQSSSNRLFSYLSLAICAWLVVFFYSLSPLRADVSLLLIRLSMLLAGVVNLLFLLLADSFWPVGKRLSPERRHTILFVAGVVMLLALSPFMFTSVGFIDDFPVPTPGWGIVFFALYVFAVNVLTLRSLYQSWHIALGDNRRQIGFLFGSTTLFLVSMFVTVLVPNMLRDVSYVAFSPLYALIFIAGTTYATFRHNMFDVKLIATEAFVIVLSVVLLFRVVASVTILDRILQALIFCATVFFGYLLIRSVKQEVATREKVQKLANSLSETNWELAKRNEQLRVIDQRKSEFVSIVSHQLRTPITAIKGYSSLALEGAFGELRADLRDALDKVFVSSGRLADMVSDFLDISKIEQGTMQFIFSKADIATMLHDVVTDVRPRAEEKGLGLHLTIPADQSFAAIVDDGKMRQIFSNVIDNSIKYTPKGEISISLERDEEQKRIICRIKDTGIGLSSDDIHHLFGKFNRGSGGSKINTGGSGLGLYVAKRMLETHGGNIWVDSPGVNKGSVFVIELPTPENVKSHTVGSWTAAAKEEDGEPVEAITGIV